MYTTRHHARRRRPLGLGEVGLFVSLVLMMFLLASLRPGTGATASARQAGLSMMNVNTPDPQAVPDDVIETSSTKPQPQRIIVDAVLSDLPEDRPMFDGRPIRRVRQINMLTTAYSPDARSCGKWADGYTASGYSVWTNGMKLVAADTKVLPFGSLVTIPGYNGGRPVPVLDRGGKIKGNRLDLLYPTHEVALKWGAQNLTVDVWEYAD
jgi:3D (Asp-Asp-Asp) domain-containing protein